MNFFCYCEGREGDGGRGGGGAGENVVFSSETQTRQSEERKP